MTCSPRPHPFLSLPDELLGRIFSFLPSPCDVCYICRVSHRLNKIADPILHKDVLFKRPESHAAFFQSLATRPRRGSLVENVRVEYPNHEHSDFLQRDESEYPIDRFSHTISTMTNLVSLVVSVPELLCSGIGHVFNGPFDLASLQSCSLLYQCENQDYWNLEDNIHVFSHPTLENLTIWHARIHEDGIEFLEKPGETALKTLKFMECDINPDALHDILALPEALSELTITQLEIPNPPLVEASDLLDDYNFAFEEVTHSLEFLSIDFPSLIARYPVRLRNFNRLTRLELRDYQLFVNDKPHVFSVNLPPNLETLRFFDQIEEDQEIIEILCSTIERKEIVAQKWTKMIVEGIGHPPTEILKVCERFDGFLVEKSQKRPRINCSDSVILENLT